MLGRNGVDLTNHISLANTMLSAWSSDVFNDGERGYVCSIVWKLLQMSFCRLRLAGMLKGVGIIGKRL
jgi:hypothetical protein